MNETQDHPQTTDLAQDQSGNQNTTAAQGTDDNALASREGFETEIVPLLSLLNAKCQQHNISAMTIIGIQGMTVENGQREQEILLHVTPYQNGTVPSPMRDCLMQLEAQTREHAAGASN